MSKIIVASVVILVAGIVLVVWSTLGAAHYGDAFLNKPAVSIAELTATPEKYVDKDIRVEGKIVDQCMISGCWFHIENGEGKTVKIEFGKTVPKLPQKKGKIAVVEGRFMKSGNDYELIGNGVEFR